MVFLSYLCVTAASSLASVYCESTERNKHAIFNGQVPKIIRIEAGTCEKPSDSLLTWQTWC